MTDDLPMGEDEDFSPSPTCRICGEETIPGSWACQRCRRLLDRVDTKPGRVPNKAARRRAMRRQWDGTKRAFLCEYTGVKLTEIPSNTRYATWEHREPADKHTVVLVADLVNRMKGDMTEAEFRALVRALANHFDGEPFVEAALPNRERRT